MELDFILNLPESTQGWKVNNLDDNNPSNSFISTQNTSLI